MSRDVIKHVTLEDKLANDQVSRLEADGHSVPQRPPDSPMPGLGLSGLPHRLSSGLRVVSVLSLISNLVLLATLVLLSNMNSRNLNPETADAIFPIVAISLSVTAVVGVVSLLLHKFLDFLHRARSS
jgi:hypothetical protein